MTINTIKRRLYKVWQVLKSEDGAEVKQGTGSSESIVELDASNLGQNALEDIRRMVLENPWVLSSEKVSVRRDGDKCVVRFSTLRGDKTGEVRKTLVTKLVLS